MARKSGSRKSGWVLGVLVGVAVLAGAGWLVPVWQKHQALSHRTACLANLHKLAQALHQYTLDYDDCWPSYEAWTERYGLGGVSGCPAAKPMLKLKGLVNKGIPGYSYNSCLTPQIAASGRVAACRTSDIKSPNLTVSVCEQAAGLPFSNGVDPYASLPSRPEQQEKGWLRHGNGAHYLFCDGHVEWLRETEVISFVEDHRLSECPGCARFAR